MKYFLNNSKSCPLCRRVLAQSIDDFSVNRVIDDLSRKAFPKVCTMPLITLEIFENSCSQCGRRKEEAAHGETTVEIQRQSQGAHCIRAIRLARQRSLSIL